MSTTLTTLSHRFWAKVQQHGDCWLWTAASEVTRSSGLTPFLCHEADGFTTPSTVAPAVRAGTRYGRS